MREFEQFEVMPELEPLQESEIVQIIQQLEPVAVEITKEPQIFTEPVIDFEPLPQIESFPEVFEPQFESFPEVFEPTEPITVFVNSPSTGEVVRVATTAANLPNVINAAQIAEQIIETETFEPKIEVLPEVIQPQIVSNPEPLIFENPIINEPYFNELPFQSLPTATEPIVFEENKMNEDSFINDGLPVLMQTVLTENPVIVPDANLTEIISADFPEVVADPEKPIIEIVQNPKVYGDDKQPTNPNETVTVVVNSPSTGEQVAVKTTAANVPNVINAAQIAENEVKKETATEDLLFGYDRTTVYVVGAVAGIALLIGLSSFGEN